jgi:hypothetical protein
VAGPHDAASPRVPGSLQLERVLARLGAEETFEEAFAGRRLKADARLVRLLPARRPHTT